MATVSTIHPDGLVQYENLKSACSALEDQDALLVYVAAQNACVLVFRKRDFNVFEIFETSARSADVLAATALHWAFPGPQVAIPGSTFNDAGFQDGLCRFLHQASHETIHQFVPSIFKAGANVAEYRDTTDPTLISTLLTTLLATLPDAEDNPDSPPPILKKVRDEVCFAKKGNPWRRSPFYLALRVFVHRYLQTLVGEHIARHVYKTLMCMVLRELCEDFSLSAEFLPEDLALCRTKLARRISKLVSQQERPPSLTLKVLNELILFIDDPSKRTLTSINELIESQWSSFKIRNQRKISRIQQKATHRDTVLALTHSKAYLLNALQYAHYLDQEHVFGMSRRTEFVLSPCDTARTKYMVLATEEEQLKRDARVGEELSAPALSRIIQTTGALFTYLQQASPLYQNCPEGNSVMLLTVLDFWISIDQAALQEYPLLEQYSIPFPEDILDVVQLANLDDMHRIKRIEDHLRRRHRRCNARLPTIFDDPKSECFAARYFDSDEEMQELRATFLAEAEQAKERKKIEWQKSTEQYDSLAEREAKASCITKEDPQYPGLRVHDDKCTKCYLRRSMRRMRIEVYEHPLPSDQVQQKSICFEHLCPAAFGAYRDATWRLINELRQMTGGKPQPGPQPWAQLSSSLSKFGASSNRALTLASTTKSFAVSHYATVRLPCEVSRVCVPCGLSMALFDNHRSIWAEPNKTTPSLAGICADIIPKTSPLQLLQWDAAFAIDKRGPTPNAVIASQTKCPEGSNVGEWLAYQDLHQTGHLQWIRLLGELASPNLNFSSPATTILLSRIALQAGPSKGGDVLRVKHWVFRDKPFLGRLLEQIKSRVEAVASNWRETQSIECMLTLTIRILQLADDDRIIKEAKAVLSDIRTTTSHWVRELRNEILSAKESTLFEQRRKDAVWACLLVRRTLKSEVHDQSKEIDSEFLQAFFEASIILQQSLEESFTKVSHMTRNALIRDWRSLSKLVPRIRAALQNDFTVLSRAISTVWQTSARLSSEDFEPWSMVGDDWCKTRLVAQQGKRAQDVAYNLVQGILLIDGQPLGQLPSEHRGSAVLKDLFGDQPLLIYPSGLPGMSFMLAMEFRQHQVHIGFRNDILVVRAVFHGTILEHIPKNIFGPVHHTDLPGSLVYDSVHWLDLEQALLHIRPRDEMWRNKESHWVLDLNTSQAYRRSSTLVDPHSQLFTRVTYTFDDFEHSDFMVVYQPSRKPLSLQLLRLDLRFEVNRNGLLQSQELNAEVDANQDAGTWYGLRSKIVLRDLTNPRLRSIIIPLGPPSFRRVGIHVAVNIVGSGQYGRYVINELLGRLDCAAEPALIYLRAQYHALTSFVLADPLTKRTGTEEGLRYLQAANAQPWTPLSDNQRQYLMMISNLSPKREYYPPGLKSMQSIVWEEKLTTHIQNDGFQPLIARIIRGSDDLAMFHRNRIEQSEDSLSHDQHLLERSRHWDMTYSKFRPHLPAEASVKLSRYAPRDRLLQESSCQAIAEIVYNLSHWSQSLDVSLNLKQLAEAWSDIRGFVGVFENQVIADIMNVDIGQQWADIVNFCRRARPSDKYKLMFSLAPLAFSETVSMDVVRIFVAFAVLADLKAIEPPTFPEYENFIADERPAPSWLRTEMQPSRIPAPDEEQYRNDPSLPVKQQKVLFDRIEMHEAESDRQLTALINFLSLQWPNHILPDEPPLDLTHINLSKAYDLIRLEWQRMAQNFHLSMYLNAILEVLQKHRRHVKLSLGLKTSYEYQMPIASTKPLISPSLLDLLRAGSRTGITDLQIIIPDEAFLDDSQTSQSTAFPTKQYPQAGASSKALQRLVEPFASSSNAIRHQYGSDLQRSLNAFSTASRGTPDRSDPMKSIDLVRLNDTIVAGFQQLSDNLSGFSGLFAVDTRYKWLALADLWPSPTPVSLVEFLKPQWQKHLSDAMRNALVQFGESLTTLQRLVRLETHRRSNQAQILSLELKHRGHVNWRPRDCPLWLILEIESNIVIRPEQIEVAQATIHPQSQSNSVLQMNMGEGKSSCIIPMVATILADKERLLRIIVPKALLPQMAQILQARLGNVLDQPVTHVPFSRRTPTDDRFISTYRDLHQNSLQRGGIILTLPEHILSFKLSGLQRLSDNRLDEARPMINMQEWLNLRSRDVLDESDFTLAVRTQLIYPSGAQNAVDGHPNRWKTVQALLDMVRGLLWNIQREFPKALEIDHRSGHCFPTAYFLHHKAEDRLVEQLAKLICEGHGSIVPANELPLAFVENVKRFISRPSISKRRIADLQKYVWDKTALWNNILLLRGLLVHRILILGLKKRWNVQYGLHPLRDPIAVPFHAKGVPSETAEWGHPDVAILLTCLAFYYAGLAEPQLRKALSHVLRSDNKGAEYERWLHGSNRIPESLRDANALNLDDELQLQELWRCFRYNTIAIDYFMNNFVFPQHAKQFEHKLQGSSWDIPLKQLVSAEHVANGFGIRKGQIRHQDTQINLSVATPIAGLQESSQKDLKLLTTGFSGTNDNRTMLPLTITQEDLPELLGTNAEVLMYLLEERNRKYMVATDRNGRRLSERLFLNKLHSLGIRVFIDAGAQILENDNLSLVKLWMEEAHAAPAAVYFNSEDKPMVHRRKGHDVPLLASPYADNLSECLIYLDEAHTRGTDLKLPAEAKGALTLGPGQTKDHTVQGEL